MSWLLITILAALAMLGALSIDAYLPALPAIAEQFAVSPAAAQQSLTAYALAFAIMNLFYGTLSDSFGRRPVILYSLVAYFVSTVGAALAPSIEALLVFRFLQGLSAGAGAVIGRAIVGDLCSGPEAHRVMSYISMVFGIAPALAPIIGGWLLAAFDWRFIFHFIATFTLILLVACFWWLHESLPRERRQSFRLGVLVKNYLEVGGNLRFMLRSLSCALAFCGMGVYIGAAPAFVIDILHLKETDFGWLFVPLVGGMTIGSFVAGKLSHRLRAETIIRLSFAVMFLSAVVNLIYCASMEVRVPWAIVPMTFYAFGVATATPAMTMIALEMFPEIRGMGASFQTFLFMLLFAVVTGLVAPLLFGHAVSFAGASMLGLILSAVCWVASSPGTLRARG